MKLFMTEIPFCIGAVVITIYMLEFFGYILLNLVNVPISRNFALFCVHSYQIEMFIFYA